MELSAVIKLRDEFTKNMRRVKESTENFNKTANRIKDVGNKFTDAGKKMTAGVTLPLAGIATAAVSTVMKFDDSMSQVRALSGATGEEFDELRNKAREMGANTRFSASEAADGLSYMALAGWDTEQMLAGIEPMLNLASAGGLELAQTSDIVTDTMSQFSMQADEAGRATDVLAKIQSSTNTDVMQLGEAFKYAGGAAAASGMDIEETSAMLGLFANQGTKGSAAGTVMTAMLRDMNASVKDGILDFDEFKVQLYDASGEMRSVGDVMADVEKATSGMSTEQRNAALSNIFQTQSLRGVNAVLSEGTDKYYELLEASRNSSGAAADAAEIMEDNIGGAFRSMRSSIDDMMIAIGDELVPYIRRGAEIVGEWAGKFSELDDKAKQWIIGIGAIFAALGPIALVISMIIKTFVTLTKAVRGVGIAFSFMSRMMLMNPFGLIITGIIALIAGIVLLVKNWGTVKDKVAEVWSSAMEWTGKAVSAIGGFVKGLWETVAGFFKQLGIDVWTVITDIAKWIAELPGKIIETLGGAVGKMLDAGKELFSGVWDGMKGIWKDMSGWVRDKVSWLTDKLMFWRKGNKEMSETASGETVDGTHYGGLWRVPFDGYVARLHKGERVLTARQADSFDSLDFGQFSSGTGTSVNKTYNTSTSVSQPGKSTGGGEVVINVGDVHINDGSDYDTFIYRLKNDLKTAWEAGA